MFNTVSTQATWWPRSNGTSFLARMKRHSIEKKQKPNKRNHRKSLLTAVWLKTPYRYSGPGSSLNCCCSPPCCSPPFKREGPAYFQLAQTYFPTKPAPVSSQHFSCCSVLTRAASRPAPAHGHPRSHGHPWPSHSCSVCYLYFHQRSKCLLFANHLLGTNCRTCCPDLHFCSCTGAASPTEQSVFTVIPDMTSGLCITVGSFENSSAS